MDYTYLGLQIRHYRRQKGLNQAQLAEGVGLSAAHVGHIERGTRRASLETVVAISRMLDVSLDILIFPEKHPSSTAVVSHARQLAEKLSEAQELAALLLSGHAAD